MADILVVSTQFSSRIAYTAALSGYGYSVTEAQSAQEAQNILRDGLYPRAVIVDLKFSNALVEAFKDFEALYRNRQRPILIVIGGRNNARLAQGMADVFLPRPAELYDLISSVQAQLA